MPLMNRLIAFWFMPVVKTDGQKPFDAIDFLKVFTISLRNLMNKSI